MIALPLCAFLISLVLAACAAQGCSQPQPMMETTGMDTTVVAAAAERNLLHIDELPPDSLLLEGDATAHPALSSAWVDSVMELMPLRRRVAQMITPFSYSSADGKKLRELREQVSSLGVGGVIVSLGSVAEAARLIDSLQTWSELPLLISADFENGAAMRLRGAVEYPSLMALGATRSPELAYAMGLAVAREARAIGVTQNYSPVADVNNNPANPVINTRSFGEHPELVAAMAEAYMRGLQDGRMIATAKHFPGHGDTDKDSHTDLPVLLHSRARLDSLELLPFRRLIRAGVLSVMTGHVAVPAVDSGIVRPATLSPPILDSLLRGELDFNGLIVTDALNMKGVQKRFGNGRAAVEAVRAGADVLLMPPDARAAIESVAAAVESGEIAAERIDRSVRRILLYKEWLGLADRRIPDGAALDSLLSDSSRFELPRTIARRAVTMLQNDGALLPLAAKPARSTTCLALLQGKDESGAAKLADALAAQGAGMRLFRAPSSMSKKEISALADSLRKTDTLLIASFVGARTGLGNVALSRDQNSLLELIAKRKTPAVLVSFGSPYVLSAIPWARAGLCAWGDDTPSIAAAVEALFGALQPTGVSPVSIPGALTDLTDAGAPHMAANTSTRAQTFAIVDSLVMRAVAARAFPGAQLMVLKNGRLAYSRTYGRFTYDAHSSEVTDSTLYDLASLTKVIATTSLAMKLCEEGRLDPDAPVAQYLPSFARGGKKYVTVRNLLLHNSGLPAFRPYERFCATAEDAMDTILAESLAYPTGTKTVYSDLGIIALGKLVESAASMPLDLFADSVFFRPLRMKRSMFNPPASLRGQCAPTELDTSWRMRLLQGEVHDERAALLGGVAGHAGLFSTAYDLSRFVLMLMNGGELDGTRFLTPETIAHFTRRQGSGSRALGWDTKSTAASSAGKYFSARSFGHTGFTGTSIWVDPDARVAVIFLSNRVHPTRENKALLSFRAVLHNAVREALAGIR